MAYYQILRQRRRDLGLSIEDVSSQTRLAPQYIQAIEENNLDVFLDDFDFVRYFVHAYSDAIGVNWEMLKDEVDLNIDQYARLKSMSYTQAQRKMEEQMPLWVEPENEPTFQQLSKPVNKPKTNKKKKSKNNRKKVEAKVSKTAKKAYKWSKKSTRNFAIAVVALVVVGLVVANLVLNQISSSQSAAAEAEKEAELKEKEEETTKLANQKKQTSSSSSKSSDSSSSKDIQIENTDYENNTFTITNLVDGDQKLTIKITIPNYTTVAVYQDDTAINDTSVTYMDSYEQTFSIDHACLIQLEIENWEDNEITINGQTVTFNSANWTEGEPAVLYFEVKDSSSDSTSDTSSDSTSSDSTTVTATEDSSTSDSGSSDEEETTGE